MSHKNHENKARGNETMPEEIAEQGISFEPTEAMVEVDEAVPNDTAEVVAPNGDEITDAVTEPVPVVIGVVTNCLRLNVRKQPDGNADVIDVIDMLTEVSVDMENSTDTFYKICLAAGIEGYCAKEFIAIRR